MFDLSPLSAPKQTWISPDLSGTGPGCARPLDCGHGAQCSVLSHEISERERVDQTFRIISYVEQFRQNQPFTTLPYMKDGSNTDPSNFSIRRTTSAISANLDHSSGKLALLLSTLVSAIRCVILGISASAAHEICAFCILMALVPDFPQRKSRSRASSTIWSADKTAVINCACGAV